MIYIDNKIVELMNIKAAEYASTSFIDSDPVQIPHLFARKEDREIAGFLTASISWGQRPTIIRNARRMMQLMDDAPSEFVCGAGAGDMDRFAGFCHRTFSSADMQAFVRSLQNIYLHHGGLEQVFTEGYMQSGDVRGAIAHFRKVFTAEPFLARSCKHVADVERKSAAKRINMFLRWMVRHDAVDMGLWRGIPASALILPLDVHTGRVGRQLGLLARTQDDWQAAEEITAALRQLDPSDPVKYDYALFGLGVFEKDLFGK